jgi:phosphoribosylformylglycinamidine synthase
VGALPLAATNNLNFGNPERPEIMAQLVESIEGLAEACRFFETPITGGNVSLYNETLGTPIFPTPVIGMVGRLPTGLPMPLAFQAVGRRIFLLGGLRPGGDREFGSTQYAKVILDRLWGTPPKLDMYYEKRVQSAVRELVRDGLVDSAHDLGDGGLAVALAEASFGANGIGADIRLDSDRSQELVLFEESPSRILVSTSNPEAVRAAAAKNSVEALEIGATLKARVVIRNRTETWIDSSVGDLYSVWNNALEHLLLNPASVVNA